MREEMNWTVALYVKKSLMEAVLWSSKYAALQTEETWFKKKKKK